MLSRCIRLSYLTDAIVNVLSGPEKRARSILFSFQVCIGNRVNMSAIKKFTLPVILEHSLKIARVNDKLARSQ